MTDADFMPLVRDPDPIEQAEEHERRLVAALQQERARLAGIVRSLPGTEIDFEKLADLIEDLP